MPRAPMRLFATILAACSFLLLLITCYCWFRSRGTYEGVLRFSPDVAPVDVPVDYKDRAVTGPPDVAVAARLRGVISHAGQLTYVSIPDPRPLRAAPGVPAPEPWETWSLPAADPRVSDAAALVAPARAHAGISFGRGTNDRLLDPTHRAVWRLPYAYVTCPYWFLAILLAIGPYLWFASMLREREERCAKCGAALAGAGACLKCGTKAD